MEELVTDGGRFCDDEIREEDVAEDEDEVEPAVGGDRGDWEWFEGTRELK